MHACASPPPPAQGEGAEALLKPAPAHSAVLWLPPAVCAQEEEALVLVDALLENDALSLLVHRLAAFDEKVRWASGRAGGQASWCGAVRG